MLGGVDTDIRRRGYGELLAEIAPPESCCSIFCCDCSILCCRSCVKRTLSISVNNVANLLLKDTSVVRGGSEGELSLGLDGPGSSSTLRRTDGVGGAPSPTSTPPSRPGRRPLSFWLLCPLDDADSNVMSSSACCPSVAAAGFPVI